MVVDNDDIIFKGGFLFQSTAHGVGNGLGAVVDGNNDGGFYGKLLFGKVGRAVVRRVDLGTNGLQMGCRHLLHLYLYLAVAGIDIVELLDARCTCVEFHLGIERLVQVQQQSFAAQEQAQGVESGILVVVLAGLHGKSVQQAGADEQQRTEVEVVADGAQLIVDGWMTCTVGIDKGGTGVFGDAYKTLKCALP